MSKRAKTVDVGSMIKEQLMKEKQQEIDECEEKIKTRKNEIKQLEEQALTADKFLQTLEDGKWKAEEGAEETYRIMSLSVLKDGFFDNTNKRGLKHGVVDLILGLARKSGRELTAFAKLNVPTPSAACLIARAMGLNAREEVGSFGHYPAPTDKDLKTYNVVVYK
jgi:hypothetical protein